MSVLSQFVINPSYFVIPVATCNKKAVAICNNSITLCYKIKLFSLVKHACLPL